MSNEINNNQSPDKKIQEILQKEGNVATPIKIGGIIKVDSEGIKFFNFTLWRFKKK